MKPHLTSCLLGGALGDSVGLPSEGLSARRIARLRPAPLRQSLAFGRGMVSDDTEHAVMTLLSLRDSNGDAKVFTKALALRLRWWFASLPAGIGLATARSIIKLWLGFPPHPAAYSPQETARSCALRSSASGSPTSPIFGKLSSAPPPQSPIAIPAP